LDAPDCIVFTVPGERRYTRLIAVALGCVVYAISIAFPVSLSGGDTLWSVPLSYSVLHEHSVYLDEFPALTHVTTANTSLSPTGHRIFSFPWGPSIVSAPLLAVFSGWLHVHHDSLYTYLNRHFAPADLEIRLASFYVALSTAVLFLLLTRRTKRIGLALLVALAFAFGTSMTSTASRALWSHTPEVLFVVLALYLFQLFEDHPEWREQQMTFRGVACVFACGLALGLAYFSRPTGILPLGAIVVALFLRRWLGGVAAAVGAAIPIAVLVAIYWTALGKPVQTYYDFSKGKPPSTFFVGLAGNLVSPARGLFVWSPFVIVALWSAARAVRHPARDRVLSCCVVVVVLHWLSISTLRPWWAGWSVGPRLFSEALPFLMVLVADSLVMLRSWSPRGGKGLAYTMVGACILFSLFTNVRAATHFSVQRWNFAPENIDLHSDRPWDWSDPQFLS
jgi:hypothetical protein